MSDVSNSEMPNSTDERMCESNRKDSCLVDKPIQSGSEASDGRVVSTKIGVKENRIEDRLATDEQPCFITVGEMDETVGRVVDISPRGMGVVLDGEYSIKPEERVELYYQQFLIIGFVANAVHFDDYVRLGISISERHRKIDRSRR